MDNRDIDRLAAEERRAYQRKWRAENKEKVRKNNESYWKRRVLKKLREQEQEEDDDSFNVAERRF